MTDLRRLALIASILLALVASAGDVYRWVDADGRVHFADSPPPGIPAEKLGIVSLPTDPAAVDLAETTRQVRENQAEADAIVASNAAKEAAAKAEQKAEQCAAAKSRYAAVQNSMSFVRPAASLEITRSCGSRQRPRTPPVLSFMISTRRTRQPAGRTAVVALTPSAWTPCVSSNIEPAPSSPSIRSAFASSGSSAGKRSASIERVSTASSGTATLAKIAWLPITMIVSSPRSAPAARIRCSS